MGQEDMQVKEIVFDSSRPSAICNIFPAGDTTVKNFFLRLADSLRGIRILDFLAESYRSIQKLVKFPESRGFQIVVEKFLLKCVDNGENGFLRHFLENSGWNFGIGRGVKSLGERIIEYEKESVAGIIDQDRYIRALDIHIWGSFCVSEGEIYILTSVNSHVSFLGSLLARQKIFAIYRLDEDSVARGTMYDIWDDSGPARKAHNRLAKFLGNGRIISYLRRYYSGFGVDLDRYK